VDDRTVRTGKHLPLSYTYLQREALNLTFVNLIWSNWNAFFNQPRGIELCHLGLVLCPPILSSISDRVPEMDENWTFGFYSSLYTKGGAQDRFILHCAFLNQSLRLELYFKIRIVLEVLRTLEGVLSVGYWMSGRQGKLRPEKPPGVWQ
jgi:hypothetical protein